jgi:hypothetical protein
VEEKPEVKKAGGVYYTPSYIVEYIVQQTVGRLIEGKTPQQISRLHILDPACGSGSFLLGAYQHLLDYHRRWYEEHDPEKYATAKRPELYQGRGGEWRLTTGEKKRILLNNIYGVDIDRQAVEVTKLSLLLQVLEGESQETLGQQLKLWRERALPDLGENIKCGNSLIGPDYFEGQLMPDEEEMRRVNPFDWEKEFPQITKAGGFDAVIGNPPYGFREIHPDEYKAYFKTHYTAAHASFEHYFLFYERSLRLLKENGRHGFIVPVTWLTIPSARSLRKFILDDYQLERVCWLPELVFANAEVNTLISVIARGAPGETTVEIHDRLGFREPPTEERHYEQSYFVASDYYINIFETERDRKVIQRMLDCSEPLGAIATPRSGYNPYEKGKGVAPEGGPQTAETVKSKPYHSETKLGPGWKPEIVGRDLGRYSLVVSGNRWIKYGPWLAAARDATNFVGRRLLVQEITGGTDRRIVATYHDGELYHSRDVIPIKIDRDQPHSFYILGILNSRLMTWYHHKRSPKAKKELFPKLLVSDLRKLPIRTIDFDDADDVARHDRMVAVVQRMLDLHEKLAAATIPADKKLYERQIRATDEEIDALVYELYGLSEEEIAIVEGDRQ